MKKIFGRGDKDNFVMRTFIIRTLNEILLSSSNQRLWDRCHVYASGKYNMHTKFWSKNLKVKGHLRNLNGLCFVELGFCDI
jgi:hypothetical protein